MLNDPYYILLDKWHNCDYNIASCHQEGTVMIVKTRVFEFGNGGYKSLSELAQAMEISVSQIYRVREGKRHINQKFIVGAIKAFPNHNLNDLFYLVSESPTVNNDSHHLAIHAADRPSARTKQMPGSTP